MIKTNYLLNFITVLVFLYSCNSQNNSHNSEDIQSKAEIQEADISSVYMGFDMNKSFVFVRSFFAIQSAAFAQCSALSERGR